MTNSKAVREQLLKQAGWVKLGKKWLPRKPERIGNYEVNLSAHVCFTCKSCWRRSLQSDLNRLQCPFCGGNMTEGRKP